jgi:adenylate cyclase
MLRHWAGENELGIEHLQTSLRLSPRTRVGTTLAVIGAAHTTARCFDKAVPILLLAMQEDPSFPTPYLLLAICYAHMGQLDEARATIDRVRRLTTVIVPEHDLPFRNPEHRELYLAGLRLAMGEVA